MQDVSKMTAEQLLKEFSEDSECSTEFGQAVKAELLSRLSGEPQEICPSCNYIDAQGKRMRACGRCTIQWQAEPSPRVERQSAANNLRPISDSIHAIAESLAWRSKNEFARLSINEIAAEIESAFKILYEAYAAHNSVSVSAAERSRAITSNSVHKRE